MKKNIYELQVIENGIAIDFSKVKINKEYEVKGFVMNDKCEKEDYSAKGCFKVEGNNKIFAETESKNEFDFIIKNAKNIKYKIKILYFIEICENTPDIDNIPAKEIIKKAKNNDVLRNYDFNCLLTLNPGMLKKGIEDGKKMICVAVLQQDTYCFKKRKKTQIATSIIKKVDTVNNCIYTRNSCYYWK